MTALLPLSSRSVRPSRWPTSEATCRPTGTDPVNEIKRQSAIPHHVLGQRRLIGDEQRKNARVSLLLHHLIADLLHCNGAERRFRRWFPDDGVAGNGGEKCIPGPDRHGKIEGGDDADRSERMPLFAHSVGGPLRLHRGAVEHARLADGEVGHVDHLLYFAVALGFDLADLERHQRAELIFFLSQGLADQTDQLASLRAPGSCASVVNASRTCATMCS